MQTLSLIALAFICVVLFRILKAVENLDAPVPVLPFGVPSIGSFDMSDFYGEYSDRSGGSDGADEPDGGE